MAQRNKGMTLTELAIVLGAMGLVMAAIWAIVGVVWDGYRFQKMNQQVQALAQAVQEYYGNAGAIPDGDLTLIIADDDHRLVPVEMLVDKTDPTQGLRHAMGGAVIVEGIAASRRLRLRLFDLDVATCTKFLMEFPLLVPEMGVARVETNPGGGGVDINPNNPIDPTSGGEPIPLSLATATTWCGDPTNNEVRLDFRIIK